MSLHVGSVWQNETGWSFLEPSQFEMGTTERDNKRTKDLQRDFILRISQILTPLWLLYSS